MSLFKLTPFVLASFVAFSSAGLMQAAEQYTFHLSTETHWGQALLEPGDYSIVVPDAAIQGVQLRVSGNGKTVFEVPFISTYYPDPNLKTSYLKISEIDGDAFVSEFSCGSAGKDYDFIVPKLKHHEGGAETRQHKIGVALK